MKRDPLIYELLRDLPGLFFRIVGRPAEVAERYSFDAVEYKAAAVRLDGLFRPKDATAGPAYLWEAQFQPSDRVYSNLWLKVGLFLEHEGPAHDWVGVVIYPTRGIEQTNLHPYRCLLDSDQLVRIYLDELPPASPDEFGLGLLQLLAAKPAEALERAVAMVPRVRAAEQPPEFKARLLELIETVIAFQFPNWTFAEVGKVLQVTDFTQTRAYQDAHETGVKKAGPRRARRSRNGCSNSGGRSRRSPRLPS